MSVCLSVYLSVCLSVCLFVCTCTCTSYCKYTVLEELKTCIIGEFKLEPHTKIYLFNGYNKDRDNSWTYLLNGNSDGGWVPPAYEHYGKGLWCTVTASGGRITFIMPDNAALDSRLYWLVPWMQFRAKWLIKWQFRGNSFLCRCRLAGWILSNRFIITLSV